MNTLIINTCNAPMYVIALKDDKRAIRHSDGAQRKYNSDLLTYIDECLNELNLAPADIDAVACVVGAGSFTGIRLGITTAHAFARGANCRLIALNEFEILAHGHSGHVLSAIDAGHGNYYVGEYMDGKELSLRNATAEELRAFDGEIIIYDGNNNYDNVIAVASSHQYDYQDVLTPLYLKASQAEREEAERLSKAKTNNLI